MGNRPPGCSLQCPVLPMAHPEGWRSRLCPAWPCSPSGRTAACRAGGASMSRAIGCRGGDLLPQPAARPLPIPESYNSMSRGLM